MANDHEKNEGFAVDLQKRETLRRMIARTAFVAPVVASFPISRTDDQQRDGADHPVPTFHRPLLPPVLVSFTCPPSLARAP